MSISPSVRPTRRRVLLTGLAFFMGLGITSQLHAQRADSMQAGGDRRFLRPREFAVLGVGLAASGALSLADLRIAHWDQSSSVQGGSGRKRFFNDVTKVNETTITLAGLAAYGIGRVTHANALTDIAKHTTESVVLTSLISQALRGPLGRTRPYVTHDSNQYDFHAFKGFTSFDNRAWPSLHSWAAPLIYAAAAMPGLSRMYLDQHWASDVLAGDVLGAVLGSRLVHYAHTAPAGAGPRWLVNATVLPGTDGALMLGLNLQPR